MILIPFTLSLAVLGWSYLLFAKALTDDVVRITRRDIGELAEASKADQLRALWPAVWRNWPPLLVMVATWPAVITIGYQVSATARVVALVALLGFGVVVITVLGQRMARRIMEIGGLR